MSNSQRLICKTCKQPYIFIWDESQGVVPPSECVELICPYCLQVDRKIIASSWSVQKSDITT